MKKIVLVLVTSLVWMSSFSQGVSFEHGTFDEALAKAKKENKLLFMDCYTTWCGPCKWMTKEIFPLKEVGDFFNENFISIKVDMEKGEGIALNKKYGVQAYPTLLFIDASGKEVHKLVGGKKGPDLIEGAKSALNPSLRLSTLKAKYDSGNKDYEFLMTYLKALTANYDRENMAVVAKEIIGQTSFEKFMTKELFHVISAANYPYGSKEFNYLLENKEAVKGMTEDYEYGSLFAGPISNYLQEYAAKCENLEALNKEVEKCNKQFDLSLLGNMSKKLSYIYYISNDELQTWYDNKIKDAEALKGEKQYIYNYNGICDEILRTPKLAASSIIIDDFTKIAKNFAADKENGLIMGHLMLAKLYLHKKEKEKAQTSFDIFFSENEKSGGNNTHPSVSNLRSAIESL